MLDASSRMRENRLGLEPLARMVPENLLPPDRGIALVWTPSVGESPCWPDTTKRREMRRRRSISPSSQPNKLTGHWQITDRLGISRTPVRDALRQLADEGLVSVKPQSGTFVALIDRRQLEEGRVIRRALELEGIKLAAARVGEAEIERLRDILALQERAAQSADG